MAGASLFPDSRANASPTPAGEPVRLSESRRAPMLTDWQELPPPPALPRLFSPAALRRGGRAPGLPHRGFRSPATGDPGHLSRYRGVWKFQADGLLPPTDPHPLALAVEMRLLTGRDSPFPLLGLVQLENRIRVLRPLGGLGPFRISVATGQLAPHDKGVTFSLITRL